MTIDEGRRVVIASLNLFLKRVEFIHSTFDVGRSMFDLHMFLSRSIWLQLGHGQPEISGNRPQFVHVILVAADLKKIFEHEVHHIEVLRFKQAVN